MKYKWVVILAVMLFSLAGCSSKASKPVEMKENKDTCDNCNMGIQDLENAAQIILEDGKPLMFDDIGCMIVYLQENSPEYEAVFIHDYATKEWISFDQSTFVQNPSIESPMSYGIAAFEDETEAAKFQEGNDGDLYSKKEIMGADIKSFKKSGMEHAH